jgi:RHS repeat-associated protein
MRAASSTQAGSADTGGAPAPDGGGPARVSISTPSLPRGGGAIRDIGEKFTTNPATGTGSLEVPIATSPGRSGFDPRLSLSYDSGSGNGVFGLGWNLSLPSVTRKTDKGLPTYRDGVGSTRDSDVFVLSGSEDLVPDDAADDVDTSPGYAIRRYRPRVDRLFARIERWTRRRDGDVHWRSLSSDNVLTVYGLDPDARLADPDDAGRVFSWLISETRDDRGNAVVFDYKPDDDVNVDLGRSCERHRGDGADPRRRNNRYLKAIRYGNRRPLLDGTGRRPRFLADLAAGPAGLDPQWMFEVVLDYGEHDADAPAPDDDGPWGYRTDPFSSYRSGFELRTTRLCQRIMMFHHVPASTAHDGAPASAGYDGLVSSTDLAYKTWPDDDAAVGAPYACLSGITRTGYRRAGGGYVRRSMPPVEFEYTEPVVQHTVHEVTGADLGNLPPGAFGSQSGLESAGPLHHWVDLHGDGIPGVLTEQADTWFYARNLSPLSTGASFAATRPVAGKPNAGVGQGLGQFTDLAADGRMDLVVFDGPHPGLFEHDDQEGWKAFRPFTSQLVRDVGATQLVDLDGDGSADVLVIEENAFVWHPSLGEAGFGPGVRISRPPDEDSGPQLLTSNETHAVHFADFTGDGLADLVRVGNGEVCYWPNLGYGRFGPKVTMDGLEPFDAHETFDLRRVLLADIDGSGTTDVIYLHGDGVRLYFNSCGNGFGRPVPLDVLPGSDDMTSITALDLLGNGTSCLVWAPSGPGDRERPLRYVDLIGSFKPHLLSRTVNNLGAETVVRYAPSTRFSLADRRNGDPWVSRLPFPVHVVERVITLDRINRNRFVTRYAYHDGHFDGDEREFCGFGAVDQWDAAEIGAFGGQDDDPDADVDAAFPEQSADLAPVLTRSWFHTGTGPRRLPQSSVPTPPLPHGLSGAEQREAQRAMKGTLLRQEVYGLDGSERAAHPYLTAEFTTAVQLVQPRGDGLHAVFTTHPVETLERHLERDPTDPRVQQELVLEVNPFGTVLKSVSIAYGRSTAAAAAALTQPADRAKQTTPLIAYTETTVTKPITDAATFPADHRIPLEAEVRGYELTEYPATGPDGRFQATDFVEPDPAHPGRLQHVFDDDVEYEQDAAGPRRRRLVDWVQTRYRADDLTVLLPVGDLERRALQGESYRLAFTKPLLEKVFRRDGTDLFPDPAALLAGSRGGYVSDGEDRWWVPSGRTFLSPAPAGGEVDAATELTYAVDHFFLPCRTRDPFHSPTASTELSVTYDDHDLLVIASRDPVGSRVAVDVDYRVLQPSRITDPNGNVGEVAFDALGAVTATAVVGKPGQLTGDSLAGFDPDPSADNLAAYFDAPLADPGGLLGSATARFVYDLNAYLNSADEPELRPAAVAKLARETHVTQLAGAEPRIQQAFSYSDGFGRVIQEKVRAEPGPFEDGGPTIDPRWIATGWTVYDAKGRPTRRYEPFFTATTNFEFGVTKGVSPVLFYDPMGRAVATLYPDDTYEKVTFTPWLQSSWDRNDTVLLDIRTDPDTAGIVEGFFTARASEPGAPPWRTWYGRQQDAPPASPQREAAAKAAAHADTPTTAHFDALGRVFLTQTDNGPDPDDPDTHQIFEARLDLDIKGNQRAVRDADRQGGDPLGRVVARQTYDLLGRLLLGRSMEAGTRWALDDASGKPLSTWDSRGRHTRTDYDPLRRPLRTVVTGADAADPDREVVSERLIYGEQHPQAAQNNLRGAVYLHLDQAGATVIEARDVKSNVLRTGRRLTSGTAYRDVVDWGPVDGSGALPASALAAFDADALEAALAAILDDDVWLVHTTYDALDRQVTTTSPHTPGMRRSVVRPRWNTANLVDGIDVDLRSDPDDHVTPPDWTPFVTGIDYDAMGRRIRIGHGNGVLTSLQYDPLTSRLVKVLTTRGADRLQDLSYVRDPVGNVTHKTDAAQQTVFFANQVVDPECGYTYDPTYRLVTATGREHLGLAGDPVPHSPHDELRCLLPHPGDGAAMGAWTEQYLYDPVGNLQELKHIGTNPANPGWTRHYRYADASAIEDGVVGAAKTSNRLTSTTLDDGPGGPLEKYHYDVHGNTVRMPHLGGPDESQNLHWGLRDDLVRVDLGGGGTTYYVYGADGHRVRKVWEKAAGLVEERIYLGGFEIFRRTQPGQRLERESLHVMDGEQRVALVETRTVDSAGVDGASPELVRYQYGDELGSAAVELDDLARIISYEEYAPFGSTTYQAVASAAEAPKRYRYTGKERDEETGFTYHGARYCAPWLGRWTSPDPAGLRTGPNAYVYVKNNPIRLVDPDGAEDTPPPAQKELGLGQQIGIGLSFAFTMATGQTPEHFGKGMLDKAHSVFVKPVLTIYGPNGMIDKAAQKGVDRAMGIQKPDEAYVTTQEHKDQLDAIIAIGSALFPGIEVSLPKIKPTPQLATATAGAGAGGGVSGGVGAAAMTDVAVDVVTTSGTRSAALAAAGVARMTSGRPQWWLRNVRASQVTASTKGYQVYVLKDSKGVVLYVGKSGGAAGLKPANWLTRVRAHIKDVTKRDWIGEVDQITVTSELTEMEAFALEEELISQTAITNKNISQGEFSVRFQGADRVDNVRSAMTKPTNTFLTDIVR